MVDEAQLLEQLRLLIGDGGSRLSDVVFNSDNARDAILRDPTDAFILAKVVLRHFVLPRLNTSNGTAFLDVAVFRFGVPGAYVLSFRPGQGRLRIFDRGTKARVESALLIWDAPNANGVLKAEVHVEIGPTGSSHSIELDREWNVLSDRVTSQGRFGWTGYDAISGIRLRNRDLSEPEARTIALDYLRSIDPFGRINFAIMTDLTLTRHYGWIYFYNSKEFLETGDIMHALGGNGPIVVERGSGSVSALPANLPVEESIRLFELSR